MHVNIYMHVHPRTNVYIYRILECGPVGSTLEALFTESEKKNQDLALPGSAVLHLGGSNPKGPMPTSPWFVSGDRWFSPICILDTSLGKTARDARSASMSQAFNLPTQM